MKKQIKISEEQLRSRYGLRPLVSSKGLPKGILVSNGMVEVRIKRYCPDQIRKYYSIRGRGVVSAFYQAVRHLKESVDLSEAEMMTMVRTFHEWVGHHEKTLRKLHWM